jgi:hemolysin III
VRRVKIGVLKEPVSSLTHLAGFFAAIVGLVLIVQAAANDAPKAMAMAIYGTSLALLFFSSAVYHFFDLGPRGNRLLRHLDHASIFLLIAGSYVPPMLVLLGGTWRISMLVAVGVLAIVGILVQLLWLDAPRGITTALYLAIGWIVVIPAPIILPHLDGIQLATLIGGGLAYSVGALVYALRWPDPIPLRFGFHEIWHLFVLAGAGAHFAFMVTLLAVPVPGF